MTTQEIKVAGIHKNVLRSDQETLRLAMASGLYPSLIDRIFTGIRRVTPQEDDIRRELRKILPRRQPSSLTKAYRIPQ